MKLCVVLCVHCNYHILAIRIVLSCGAGPHRRTKAFCANCVRRFLAAARTHKNVWSPVENASAGTRYHMAHDTRNRHCTQPPPVRSEFKLEIVMRLCGCGLHGIYSSMIITAQIRVTYCLGLSLESP